MEAASWLFVAPAAAFTTALFFVLRGLEWCRLGGTGRNFKKRINKTTEVKKEK